MTTSVIKPATFRFVAQYLNHCATAVLPFYRSKLKYQFDLRFKYAAFVCMYVIISVYVPKGPAGLLYRSQKQFWRSEYLLTNRPEIETDKKTKKICLYWYIAICSVGIAHWLDTKLRHSSQICKRRVVKLI
jgi:hypothetical protein